MAINLVSTDLLSRVGVRSLCGWAWGLPAWWEIGLAQAGFGWAVAARWEALASCHSLRPGHRSHSWTLVELPKKTPSGPRAEHEHEHEHDPICDRDDGREPARTS
jgi:hypothetical protein